MSTEISLKWILKRLSTFKMKPGGTENNQIIWICFVKTILPFRKSWSSYHIPTDYDHRENLSARAKVRLFKIIRTPVEVGAYIRTRRMPFIAPWALVRYQKSILLCPAKFCPKQILTLSQKNISKGGPVLFTISFRSTDLSRPRKKISI